MGATVLFAGMELRYGMFDQLEHPGGVPLHQLYRDRIGLVERAEQAGFWGYHKSEHHLIPLDAAPSTSVFLAAVAERTSSIRLCSLVHLLPFHHPLRLAEEICMLDHLSQGRFEFGFGKGVSAPEHLLWGLDPAEADERTAEGIDLLLAALQQGGTPGSLFSWEGRHWTFRDVPLELGPYQAPYPPLWRPGTLDTAARLGVRTFAGGPLSVVAAAAARYRELVQSGIGGGHEPMLAGVRKFLVAPTDEEAIERGRVAWVAYTEHLTRLFRRFEVAVPNDPTIGGDYDRARAVQAVVVGSPATVRDHVEQFAAEAGTDYLVGCFAWGDLTRDEVYRSFDLFADHAMV